MAWLPQRPHFLHGSVAENLRLGDPDASEDQLWSALRRVALEERVLDLPGGLRADVGEDGKLLSAGERARLALARVLVADRPWVFMDEPTAHLDPLTELIIADTILELGRTSGVVVVAHDEAMLALGDQLLVLETPPSAMPVAAPAAPARRPLQRAVPAGTEEEEGGSDPQPPATFWSSTVLAALASASGVALTATAGWLIVQASTHPPVLTLLVAIVAVRTFGLARPVLRYVERLRSHDAALRLLARRRVDVYDALVPLVPGRLGKQRGDVLTSVVDDVDSVVDSELRVKLPLRSYALVWLLAVVATGALLPCSRTGDRRRVRWQRRGGVRPGQDRRSPRRGGLHRPSCRDLLRPSWRPSSCRASWSCGSAPRPRPQPWAGPATGWGRQYSAPAAGRRRHAPGSS